MMIAVSRVPCPRADCLGDLMPVNYRHSGTVAMADMRCPLCGAAGEPIRVRDPRGALVMRRPVNVPAETNSDGRYAEANDEDQT